MVGGYFEEMKMPRKSTKTPKKTEGNAQSESETLVKATASNELKPSTMTGGGAAKEDGEVRINIRLTSKLYQTYLKEAQDRAMSATSLMAFALDEWAKVTFADAVPVLDPAQVAAAAAIAAQMMGEAKGKE